MQSVDSTGDRHFERGRRVADGNGLVSFTACCLPGSYGGVPASSIGCIFTTPRASLKVTRSLCFPGRKRRCCNNWQYRCCGRVQRAGSGCYLYCQQRYVFSQWWHCPAPRAYATVTGTVSTGYVLYTQIADSLNSNTYPSEAMVWTITVLGVQSIMKRTSPVLQFTQKISRWCSVHQSTPAAAGAGEINWVNPGAAARFNETQQVYVLPRCCKTAEASSSCVLQPVPRWRGC